MPQKKKTATGTARATKKKAVEATSASDAKNLVIVESPSKAKTIQKYLNDKFGKNYRVLSSKGHIADLPQSKLGVDIQNDFTPEYTIPRKDGKPALLHALKKAASESEHVYLATDPDREGEAIAWHLARLLGLDMNGDIRVAFDAITKNVVTKKIQEPRKIDMNTVNAQQARRVLDRLVGYKLSPFLWKKVKHGLSAGRVQSVATRMVVDREREIRAFVPEEYWTLNAVFANGAKTYRAAFYGTAAKKIAIRNEEQLNGILSDIDGAQYTVVSLKNQPRTKAPKPPFTTSSLQQDASARLNMRPSKTMSVAQALYEGVSIKGIGLTGLITYMRTDSLRISPEASAMAKEVILSLFGADAYPEKPRVYKAKSNAQDAHEAIRPTHVELTPERVKESLTNEQYRLYKLIWDRFMASQMANAQYEVRNVDIGAGKYIFKATHAKLVKKGFTVLYNYAEEDEGESSALPANIREGDVLDFRSLEKEQKFTQPPSRYTEASLIKALEENGIGRPSTFATIVSTIIERGYVDRSGKVLSPTQTGEVTTDLMIEYFPDIVDMEFTADMEHQLDRIAHAEKTYLETMQNFYGGFEHTLEEAEKKTEGMHIRIPEEESDVICEKCGARMVYRNGAYGKFLACPNFPQCKNTKSILTYADGACPKCGKPLIARKTRKGKTFYACEDKDGCNFMTWDTPTKKTCPQCGKTLFRHVGRQLVCLNESCGYTAKAEKTEEDK